MFLLGCKKEKKKEKSMQHSWHLKDRKWLFTIYTRSVEHPFIRNCETIFLNIFSSSLLKGLQKKTNCLKLHLNLYLLTKCLKFPYRVPGQKSAHTSACMCSQTRMSACMCSKTCMSASMCFQTCMCACMCAHMCSQTCMGACMCSQCFFSPIL